MNQQKGRSALVWGNPSEDTEKHDMNERVIHIGNLCKITKLKQPILLVTYQEGSSDAGTARKSRALKEASTRS